MYSEGCKAVAAGMNPMDLRRGVQMAVDQVVADLALMSQPTVSSGECGRSDSTAGSEAMITSGWSGPALQAA